MGTYLQSLSSSRKLLLGAEGNGFGKSHCQADEMCMTSHSVWTLPRSLGPEAHTQPQHLKKACSPVGLGMEFSSLLPGGFPCFIVSFIIQTAAGCFHAAPVLIPGDPQTFWKYYQ